MSGMLKFPIIPQLAELILILQLPSINSAGQIAFFAEYKPIPTFINMGLFSGSPGNWRKVIASYDSIDGDQIKGLAFSRNPMQSIDAEGNVVFWADTSDYEDSDRLMMGVC